MCTCTYVPHLQKLLVNFLVSENHTTQGLFFSKSTQGYVCFQNKKFCHRTLTNSRAVKHTGSGVLDCFFVTGHSPTQGLLSTQGQGSWTASFYQGFAGFQIAWGLLPGFSFKTKERHSQAKFLLLFTRVFTKLRVEQNDEAILASETCRLQGLIPATSSWVPVKISTMTSNCVVKQK